MMDMASKYNKISTQEIFSFKFHCEPPKGPATLGEQCNAEVTCEEGLASQVILLCGSKHEYNLDRDQWSQY